MNDNSPIKYSDLLQPDDSFKDLLSQLEQVSSKYKSLQTSIKNSAEAIKNSLANVNSTTAQGQEIISNAAKKAGDLAKKEKELEEVYSETNMSLISKNRELQKANRIAKLQQKLAETEASSYDHLSAQYSLNKIRLNEMTRAQRENTAEGRALVEETANIYKQMKALQEVTGKHTLSVGDYGIATVNLAADIRSAIQALTQMRLEGKEGDAEYQRLLHTLKGLKKQYSIVKTETQSLGSQTASLNQIVGALSSTSGALTAVTGLLDDSENDWAQALLKVNKLIAVTNGLMAFVNGLYKQAYVTNLLMNISKKTEIRLRAMNIARIKGEISSTILLTAAQKALNVVVKANPFFILGSVIVGVATGIALLTSNTKKAKSQIDAFNKSASSMRDILKSLSDIINKIPQLKIDSWNRAIEIHKEVGNSEEEIFKLEQNIFDERQKMYDNDLELYQDYVDNLDKYAKEESDIAAALKDWRELIFEKYTSKGKKVPSGLIYDWFPNIFRGSRMEVGWNIPEFPAEGIKKGTFISTKDVEGVLQEALENVQAKVEIGVDLVARGADLEKEMKIWRERVWKAQEALSISIAEQDAKLIPERFEQREALTRIEYDAEITALEHRLDTEVGLTAEHEEYLRNLIEKKRKERNMALDKIDYERLKSELAATRATEDAVQKGIKDGFDKRRNQINQNYARETQDIQNELERNTELTLKEKEELNRQIVALETARKKELSDLAHEEYKDILSITRATEDSIIESKAESFAKQLEQLETQHQREKEDIQDRLNFEALTEEQQEALSEQLFAIDQKYAKQRLDLDKSLRDSLLSNDKELWETRQGYLNKYTQDYLQASLEIIKAEREVALTSFEDKATELGLSDTDRQEGRLAIIKNYNDQELTAMQNHMQDLFDLDQELAESEFNLIQRSEFQKSNFTRKQEIARLKEILRLNKEYGNKLTAQEIQIIENRIKALENQLPEADDIYDLIGIPSGYADLLDDLVSRVLEAYEEILDARMELAEAQVSAAEEEVDATKSALDAELEARANGYASNVALARKEFAEAKKREKEALAFKQQVQEEQDKIDAISQASSLITATSQFWATSASLGPIAGPIAAAIATAAMWTAFLTAKVKAKQLKAQASEYGEGHVELLRGGSHASGNDISLGTAPDGTERRAEGGEYFAIINKRNSRKYGKTIEDVVNAFNSGTFEEKFANRPNEIRIAETPSVIPSVYSALGNFSKEFGRTQTTDISRIEKDVSALKEQMKVREYVMQDGTIVQIKGNTTRRIKHA